MLDNFLTALSECDRKVEMTYVIDSFVKSGEIKIFPGLDDDVFLILCLPYENSHVEAECFDCLVLRKDGIERFSGEDGFKSFLRSVYFKMKFQGISVRSDDCIFQEK